MREDKMMKKQRKVVTYIGLVIGMFVLMNSVWIPGGMAQERIPGLSKGLTFGAARFSDGDLGTGLSGRVFLEYAPYIHEIALRLSGGYLRFEDVVELGRGALSSRESVLFEDMYLTGGIVYRFSRGHIVPFVTGNLGLYRYQKEDVYPASGVIINGVQLSPYDVVKEKTGNDFGINLGGGVEFFTGDNTSMSVEMLLHSIQGEVNSEIVDLTVVFRFLPK
jgi:hypothetical protein